jgi:hypothetical protein
MKYHRRSVEERQAISRGMRLALKKKRGELAGRSEHEAKKIERSKPKVKRAKTVERE